MAHVPLRVAWFGHAAGRRADGLSSYSAQMVSALRRRGAEVLFFADAHDGEHSPSPATVWSQALHFKTVTLPVPGTARRVASELEGFDPDVVHISLNHSLLDACVVEHARASGIPTVVTVHLPYARARSGRDRVLRALYRFHRRALVSADRCVALSEDQRAVLLGIGCEPGRIDVIPNAVDATGITPGASRLRSTLRAAFVVAYVGRLDPEKRVADLVRAFREAGWPDDHHLVIAGTGTREGQVRRLAADDDRVHVLGAIHDRDECIDLLRGADVFVLPSTAEGLSLSLLEAMAAGCAVIATDVGDDGAAVGDSGIRLPAGRLEPALSEALQRLRGDADLRRALGSRARARVRAQYSLDVRVTQLWATYAALSGDTPVTTNERRFQQATAPAAHAIQG
ncbi:MAG: glycosyltransferase family 4 protein [Candidatus Dormibacteria bacterium]